MDVAGSFSMFYTLHCRLVPCLGSVLGDLLGKEEGREMIGQGTVHSYVLLTVNDYFYTPISYLEMDYLLWTFCR